MEDGFHNKMGTFVRDFAELILGLGILINAIIALLTYIKTSRNAQIIKKLEVNTNSIKDELVKATAEAEHAKGVLVGRALERIDNREK